MKKLKLLLICAFAISMGMQSCKTAKNMPTSQLQGKWILQSMDGQDAKTAFTGKIPTMTVNLTEGTINGSGGCNNYNGKFTLNKDEFTAPNLASTMRMCMESNKEPQFLQALGKPSKLSLKGDVLTFTQNGKQVLVFAKAKPLSAADLAGTWTLQSMQGASANVNFGDKAPTLTFDFDAKKVGGNSGCNRYNASFTLNNDMLEVGKPMGTRMACPNLEGEGKFLKLLEKPAKIEVEGNMLVLREEGRELLRFTK